MEPGLSELGTWNAGGATWETGATAAAEVGRGAVVVVVLLSGLASTVAAALAVVGGIATVGAVMEEGGSGVGAVVAKGSGGVGAVTAAAVVSVTAASAAGSGTTRALTTAGPVLGSLSGGGVGSEGCGETFGSSEVSEEAARRLPKDVGEAEAVELDWVTEKAGLGFGSGGLNKLPDAVPLDKSVPVESSADFWGPATKLNCAAPLPIPSPVSPEVNEPTAGFVAESFASSPWPTRSPEKQPRVSPPIVLRGGGSILEAVVVEAGLSPDGYGGRVGDPVPRAGEVDFGVRENGSSPVWPNIILPFPPKENLFKSFTCEIPTPCVTEAKLKPVDPDAKEKPLLVFCSAELAGATETSGLDD